MFIFGMFATGHIEYGGDAYTGIQNAAADTANNVLKAGGIVVAALGQALLVYSQIKAFEYEVNQKNHQELLDALAKVTLETSEEDKSIEMDPYEISLLAKGGWKCDCGEIHGSYLSTCSCGKTKRDVLASQKKG